MYQYISPDHTGTVPNRSNSGHCHCKWGYFASKDWVINKVANIKAGLSPQ